MGDVGFPTRVLGRKFGAPFTYAAFNKERGIAPGLPSLAELRDDFHYDEIDADTQIYGVMGDPVAHSLSPLVHNHAFRGAGVNAVYVPFRVPRADLVDFLKEFERLPVRGYSVTLPHKETAAALADVRDEAVADTQAANTLVRRENGGFTAFNTDFQGILDSLRANLSPAAGEGPSFSMHSRTVLVLGAGGVARAVTHALYREGALLTIANRTTDRAHKLAEEVGCRHIDWAGRHSVSCEFAVNCTSLGMHPNVDESPLHPSFLKPGLIVLDAVYTPETTLLVKEARSRGCQVITGVDLFVRQAALQFSLFTGRPAPLEVMRRVLKRALSPVTIKMDEEEV
jgi:3-dehydroquinate dehydratase/shikimate dehydrogenase